MLDPLPTWREEVNKMMRFRYAVVAGAVTALIAGTTLSGGVFDAGKRFNTPVRDAGSHSVMASKHLNAPHMSPDGSSWSK
jgi:hypothetical protein